MADRDKPQDYEKPEVNELTDQELAGAAGGAFGSCRNGEDAWTVTGGSCDLGGEAHSLGNPNCNAGESPSGQCNTGGSPSGRGAY